jgi:protease PrsW
MDIQLIIAAILPPIFVIYYIYKQDLHEKEPHKLLFFTFLLGVFSCVPILFIELTFDENFFKNQFLYYLIGIGFVEEGVKYLILIIYNYPKEDFNEQYDGILYTVVMCMGFALVENIGYVLGDSDIDGMSVAILRMFTAIPLHATCGIIMGFYLGKAKMDTNSKLSSLILALIIPTIIHGLYDYFLSINVFVFSIITLISALIYGKNALKIHQSNSPFKL